jgi:hypothetical protein
MDKNLKRILIVALLVQIAMVTLVGPVSAGTVKIDSSFSGENVYADGYYIGTAGSYAWLSTGWHYITSYIFGRLNYANWHYIR